jgi:PAS domain S-box-containing protein
VYEIELEMQNEELRRAHLELEESRNKYADLYDFAPVGYFTLSEKGVIQEVNPTGAKLLDRERYYLINRPFFRYVVKENHNAFYSYGEQLLKKKGTRQSCELKMLRKDGRAFYAGLEGISIFDNEGNFSHLRIAIVDITHQREKAKEELFESEERFRTMADSAPVMIWMAGTDKLCTYFNKGWLEFTGTTMEEEFGNGWAEGVHPDDLARCLNTYVSAFEARQEFKMEYRLKRYDGEYRWILDHGTPRFLSDGNFAGYIGSCIDITERRLGEETLRESEERFRIVADNAPIMLWMTGPDKLCNYVNKGWLELKGRSIEEELGNGWSEGIHPDDLEHCLNTYLTACDARQEFKVEYRLKRHDGEYRWILAHGVPWFTGDNSFVGYIGCCEDITDRKLVMELQKERLRFETLLSEISSRFINLAPNSLDRELEQSLKELVEFLGFDRSSIGLFSEGMKKLYVTHSYAQPGIETAPRLDLAAKFTWYTDKLRKGEALQFSDLPYDLPDEAVAEREYCIKEGFKSHLAIPLRAGNSLLGVLGFGSYSSSITWPKEFVQRLRIIGEIFASAILRKRDYETILHRDNLLQTIFSSLSSQVVVLDQEGNIIYASESWEQFTKEYKDKMGRMLVGYNYLDIYQETSEENDQSAQEILAGIHAVLGAKLPAFTFECPFRASTGEYWYLMHVDPMPHESGGVVISYFDITERKKSEIALQKALSEIVQLKNQLQAENIYLREEIKLESSYDEIVGASGAIRSVLSQAEQVANTGSTVLLFGETGTGKELIARAIHKLSPLKGRSLIKVNCAALPSTLIEAELFGREKGAYTGALSKQIGRFELANGSTIFLDEISELSLELQSKMLRVLQEGELERLGSPETIKVDVRVIAATNRNLGKAVQDGKFREDLYYRLNVFPIHIPPLRERKEDIPMLVWSFVKEFGEKMGKRIEKIPRKSMEALQLYSWPGNVRELRNVIERAMILAKDSILQVALPKNEYTKSYQGITLEDAERKHILEVLEMTNWRIRGKGGASEILGLKPSTLESKMAKLGLGRKK